MNKYCIKAIFIKMIRLNFQLAKFSFAKGHILAKLFLAFGLLLALVGPQVLAD